VYLKYTSIKKKILLKLWEKKINNFVFKQLGDLSRYTTKEGMKMVNHIKRGSTSFVIR
jgi:hypothetical protein